MSLSVKEILSIGQRRLQEAGVADAAIDSRLLYCFMTGIERGRIFLMYQNTLQDDQCDEYFRLVDERAGGMPLQYITGTQEFMGLEFFVDENVLIPRQDTETMVEDVISLVKDGMVRGGEIEEARRKEWRVLDLCTGSGAIGLSLAKLLTGVKLSVTCSDISGPALGIARKNAEKLGVTKSVRLVEGDMLSPFSGRSKRNKFDLIVSNPPYICSDVIPTLQTEVKDHEPMEALDGGKDGLDFYRVIGKEAASRLKKNGFIFLEIGFDQGKKVTDLLEESGEFTDIICLKDLAGKDRIVFARKAE